MTNDQIHPQKDDRAAVDKAISLLASFGADGVDGVGVSELARRADLSKSTAFRVLGALQRNGVIERTGTDYRIGPRLHEVTQSMYAPGQEELRDLLIPHLLDLFERTRETVHLASLVGTDVVYLGKLYGHQHLPSPSRIGRRIPAHSTAVGKVLLAFNPAAGERAVAGRLLPFTESTITDPTVLATQLADVRRTGVALECGEIQRGLSCIAVPVLDPRGRAVAALSVSAASGRLREADHSASLRRVARTASQSVSRWTFQRSRAAANRDRSAVATR